MEWKGDGMSVLIKGMEMPASCFECKFSNAYGWGEDEYWCDLKDRYLGNYYTKGKAKWYNERREFCPLVEVSDGQEEWLDGMNVLYGEEEEPRYCDRNICASNEVNGISCDECEVAKYHNLEDDDSPCLDCGEEEKR